MKGFRHIMSHPPQHFRAARNQLNPKQQKRKTLEHSKLNKRLVLWLGLNYSARGQRGRPPKSLTADSNYSAIARNALGRPDQSKTDPITLT